MKTLDAIKQEYARENNFCEWSEILYSIDDPAEIDEHFDEVAKRYALEACRETLNNAAKYAYMIKGDDTSNIIDGFKISKGSIVSEKNIPKEVKS